jgi:hypothetical protein
VIDVDTVESAKSRLVKRGLDAVPGTIRTRILY